MKIKKVLLIVPPAVTIKNPREVNPLPPMGLGYLASILGNMDIEVKILDCLIHGWNHEEEVNENIIRVGLSDRDIEAHIRDFNPDMVGVNCQFSRQFAIYHKIFSLVKRVNSKCIVIAGGAHTSVCPEEVINDPNCDFILIGEAEESLKHLVSALVLDSEISHIDGLGWKSNGKVNINPKENVITNLDSIPFPAYHLMGLDKYFGLDASHGKRHKRRFCPIVTSRGCPAKCTFCSAHKVWGNKYRFRSVDNVIREMRLLKDEYHIEELMFEDDNVTANPKRAKELFLRMIEEQFNYVWDTPNGVGIWSIDYNMIDLMKQSGCIRLNFPIESGSQHVLDEIIKKPLKLSRAKELIQYCEKIKLDYGMFLVIGMPGEKIDDMWKSFHFAADCHCYNPHISIATPYPGTELFDVCMKNNLFSKEFSLEDLFIRSFMIKTDEWDDGALRKIFLRGSIYLKYREFKENPAAILEWTLRKVKSPKDLIGSIKKVFQAINTTNIRK
jgi:anaerobic magnesium-protoporphyrin IX monomethyl ester cyclase